jgi:hypothetical protein
VPKNVAVWADGATDSSTSIQSRRPNQALGDANPWLENAGRTRWDQILLIGRARLSGLFAQVNWAWTKGRRNFNGGGQSQFARDWDGAINDTLYPDLMLDFGHNQTIAGFLVWDLPILRHDNTAKGKILGGWSVTANGTWSFANKGASVFAGYDSNANGEGLNLASVVGNISYPKTAITGQGDLLYQWFDPSAFAYPNGTMNRVFGPTTTTAGANVLNELPWYWMVNAGLMKDFRIAGDARLQLRFETFNLFNHANLNGPNGSVNSSDFGKIRGKYGEGRRIQMGLRFIF